MQPSDPVARIIWLERELKALKRKLEALQHQAAQEAQQQALAGSGGGPGGGGLTFFTGKTSSAGISAASAGTCGSASVTLYDNTALPTLTATSTVVTAYGVFPDAASGIYRVDGVVVNGVYVILSAACTTG